MIGHSAHPRVEGTMGQLDHGIHLVENSYQASKIKVDNSKIAYVTQTTLSTDDTANIIAT